MKTKINFKNFKGGPRNLLLLGAFFLVSVMVLTQLTEYSRNTHPMSYSTFLKNVELDQVRSVHIIGQKVYGLLRDGRTRFETVMGDNPKNWDILRDHNVEMFVAEASSPFGFWHILSFFALLLPLMVVAIWYFTRQSRTTGSGGNSIFTMGKSKAKMFLPSQIKVNFDSVAGAEEAKEELSDVVDFLRNPEKYRRLGAKLTRGVLLVGEPGNGKTLLARAVAGEANCPFFSISGSDFIEVFVGVGASRVRDLFSEARKKAPAIIFIDEIDAIGRQRGSGLGGSHDEREQTLNQLLTEMDGFDTAGSPVIVLAATNIPEVLDKALLRPGRFDRKVMVPFPDLVSREQILEVHAKGVKIDSASVDLKKVARGTTGFSGADLANLINEAAINASKRNRDRVELQDFDEARDKILMGKERKSLIMSPAELKMTAFHEAGHALVNVLMPEDTEPLYKVTIIPRGESLGSTHWIPLRDKYSQSKEELLAAIICALGGRAAEELVFSKISTGAASDFYKATDLARKMVCFYGMTSTLGPIIYMRSSTGKQEYSEETARMIDQEIRSIIDSCYNKALTLLKDNRDKLDALAHELLDRETLHASEVYALLNIPPREGHLLQ